MGQPLTAALLSALVFPGAGHYFLKKRIVGILLASVAFAALTIVIVEAVERTLQIVEKIQRGEVPLDIETIKELVAMQLSGSQAPLINIAALVFLISWVFGIVDSFRVGRLLGKNEPSSG